jgi:hypothetical protein
MNAHIIDKVALALLNHSRVSVGKKPLASLGDYDGVSYLTESRVENIDANTWRERAIVALEAAGWSTQVQRITALEGMCRHAGYSAEQIKYATPYIEVMGE